MPDCTCDPRRYVEALTTLAPAGISRRKPAARHRRRRSIFLTTPCVWLTYLRQSTHESCSQGPACCCFVLSSSPSLQHRPAAAAFVAVWPVCCGRIYGNNDFAVGREPAQVGWRHSVCWKCRRLRGGSTCLPLPSASLTHHCSASHYTFLLCPLLKLYIL